MPLAMVDARVPFVGAVTIVTGDGPREPVSFATMSIVPGPPLGRQTVSAVATGAAAPRTLKSGSEEVWSRVDAVYSQVAVVQPTPLQVTSASTRYSVGEPAGATELLTQPVRPAASAQVPT